MKTDAIPKFVFGLFILSFFSFRAAYAEDLPIRVVKTEEARIDVFVGDELFTSYHYGLGFDKPIFYPLKSPAGNPITRGYPIELGIPGEAHDHWHHESLWFTYGNVNGTDFWAKQGARRGVSESGKIRHTGFSRLEGGKKGHLEASADWITPEGKVILRQKSQVVFRAGRNGRLMDLTIELTAHGQKVTFGDTKEGMFGIRVTPALRENHTGVYLNASGQHKEAGVWGKRSPWVALRGKVRDEQLTLAIFNHPESTGFPTFWHARGYGLFAANPFGKIDFEKGSEPLNFALHAGESAVFRYRILIHSDKLTGEELEKQFQDFVRVGE
ncbi:PmoA family protein [Acidobacteria bacterium AH-259-G07]|nr:PmoA family protein [Acidobacteria bacterium AH-259-G07]